MAPRTACDGAAGAPFVVVAEAESAVSRPPTQTST